MIGSIVERGGFIIEELEVPAESAGLVARRWRVTNCVNGQIRYVAALKTVDGHTKLACDHCRLSACLHISVIQRITQDENR